MGCGDAHTLPTDSAVPTDATSDAATRECAGPTGELDLLLVIENAGNLLPVQYSLTRQFPRMIDSLVSGELRDADGTLLRMGTPVTSLHLGVVDSDMGSGGFDLPTCADSNFGDDGILRSASPVGAPECAPSYPTFLDFRTDTGDPATLASDATCLALGVGTDGCGIEQHLDAMLKAITPSSSPLTFQQHSAGHGDHLNAGFLRADSVLAVILLAEEDDCSASDGDLFNSASTTYPLELNLRCATYPEALHPVSRYVDGLLALRPDHPERVVFGVLAGVPADLIPDSGPVDYSLVLIDPRMQTVPDPSAPSHLQPSCVAAGRGWTFPPVRITTLARDLDVADAHVALQSSCQGEFDKPMTAILNRTFDALAGGCTR